MRTGFNLSVDQLHNILISEPCEEGTYRDSSMTSCDKCDAGKEPNTDKTGCGEKYFMIASLQHEVEAVYCCCFTKDVGGQTDAKD